MKLSAETIALLRDLGDETAHELLWKSVSIEVPYEFATIEGKLGVVCWWWNGPLDAGWKQEVVL
jgi:hypothetical protein